MQCPYGVYTEGIDVVPSMSRQNDLEDFFVRSCVFGGKLDTMLMQ